MDRRAFLKGMVAAPVALSAWNWDDIFRPDDGKDFVPKPLNSEYQLYRNAVSLGPTPVTIKQVKNAKEALMKWVINRKLQRYAKNFRFFYDVDDFGNELGIAVSVYTTEKNETGMTWGQMIRQMRNDGMLI